MQDNQANFHSVDGKRLILVVDDEEINRALLGTVLENYYEVIFAENGEKALHIVEENKKLLSLVILDLIMPVMPGREVLCRIKEEPAYQDEPEADPEEDEEPVDQVEPEEVEEPEYRYEPEVEPEEVEEPAYRYEPEAEPEEVEEPEDR